MKYAVLVFALALLPACRTGQETERKPAPESLATDQRTSELDFSAWKERSMTVEEFVKVCQQVSGFNFTYADSTRVAMNATSLRFDGPDRVPVGEFGTFLTAQLGRCGFTCGPVGPEHLRVLLVQPRPI